MWRCRRVWVWDGRHLPGDSRPGPRHDAPLTTTINQGEILMTIRTKGIAAAGALGIALLSGAASGADAPASAPAAAAADYAVLHLNVSVDAPVDVVWKKVG